MGQAEEDIKEFGLEALPLASPARWFRWSTRKSKHVKPADNKPNTNWCSDWVWDPDVNASYYGVWGCQPTTDFASPQWRAEMVSGQNYTNPAGISLVDSRGPGRGRTS